MYESIVLGTCNFRFRSTSTSIDCLWAKSCNKNNTRTIDFDRHNAIFNTFFNIIQSSYIDFPSKFATRKPRIGRIKSANYAHFYGSAIDNIHIYINASTYTVWNCFYLVDFHWFIASRALSPIRVSMLSKKWDARIETDSRIRKYRLYLVATSHIFSAGRYFDMCHTKVAITTFIRHREATKPRKNKTNLCFGTRTFSLSKRDTDLCVVTLSHSIALLLWHECVY